MVRAIENMVEPSGTDSLCPKSVSNFHQPTPTKIKPFIRPIPQIASQRIVVLVIIEQADYRTVLQCSAVHKR